MQRISSSTFQRIFRFGIDLSRSPAKDLGLATNLDQNGDRQLCGRELGAVFAAVDRFDQDGSRHSFQLTGRTGRLFAALLAARRSGPYRGAAIAAAARDRCARLGPDYAVAGTPTSPDPRLSQNRHPGRSRLHYLRDQWKCNQFVGDALSQAGMEMPTYKMAAGGEHYMTAEALPLQERHFDRLCQLAELAPGDVIVVDWPPRGAATAHTEVVTAVSLRSEGIRTAGAHHAGAWESTRCGPLNSDWYDVLQQATFNPEKRCWQHDGFSIYLLRPLETAR